MANQLGNYAPTPYYEADPNNCVCADVDVAGTTPAVSIPGPVEEADRVDLYFDVAEATGPDYFVTGPGDRLTVGGDEAYRQSLLRRFITNPGEWQTKPQYGAGGREFVKGKSTKATRDAFMQRLRAQSLMDPRTASVLAVNAESFADGSGWKYS